MPDIEFKFMESTYDTTTVSGDARKVSKTINKTTGKPKRAAPTEKALQEQHQRHLNELNTLKNAHSKRVQDLENQHEKTLDDLRYQISKLTHSQNSARNYAFMSGVLAPMAATVWADGNKLAASLLAVMFLYSAFRSLPRRDDDV